MLELRAHGARIFRRGSGEERDQELLLERCVAIGAIGVGGEGRLAVALLLLAGQGSI